MAEFNKTKNQDSPLAGAYRYVGKLNASDNLCKLAEIADLAAIDIERQVLSALAEGRAEGRAEGIAVGRDEGIAAGMDEERRKIVISMLSQNCSIEDIARLTGLKPADIHIIATRKGNGDPDPKT